MKVCAVIVTYGDRFHLLKQVIEACFREGVDKVIVVDNASIENSRKLLKEFEIKNKDKLQVIYLDKNTGSAGGYKRGLQEAYKCEECEFIWLLDDDNEPQKGSLKVLKDFWNNLEYENKKKIALLSYRLDKTQYKMAIMINNPDFVLGMKNSFYGFHVANLMKKFLKILKRDKDLIDYAEKNIRNGKISVAPYGGMFFHKKLVENIGYPREEFFVYADDYEWSYRITKQEGKIILLLDSKVKDIDISWNTHKNKFSNFKILPEKNEFRIYYSIRNRVIFERELLVNNKFIYYINEKTYLLLVKLFSKSNFSIVKKAINDAKSKKFFIWRKEFHQNEK